MGYLLLSHYSCRYKIPYVDFICFCLSVFQDPRKLLFATGKSFAKLNEKSLLLLIITLQTKLLLILYWHAPFVVSQLSGVVFFVLI